ncbi:MAG TPA: hypothetical protein VFA26_17415 [Gemmataceae bacterium]|nr:hypothetical protein [Gemmataceae bacterium]
MPAFVVPAGVALEPVAAPETEGEALLVVAPGAPLAAPDAPAEAAVEARAEAVLVVVPGVPPRPNVTAPVASWTLMGGGGMTPART